MQPTQTQSPGTLQLPAAAKWPAHVFSVIFHPLFIPLYVSWYLVFILPGFFTGFSPQEKLFTVIRVGYNTIVFPALTVLLLRGLGFLKSFQLRERRERFIPLIATNIFYFWVYLVLKNQPDIPVILRGFILSIFITSSASLLANLYFKISLHGLGMGGVLGLVLILVFLGYPASMFLAVMIALLLTGLVCTSRLIVSNHTPFEIYAGVLLGIICQFVGFLILM